MTRRWRRAGGALVPAPPTPATITTDDVSLGAYIGGAGQEHLIRCPRCAETVSWAPAAWWSTRCACGYRWRVEVRAVGERDG